jgi:hypothetical protein
MWSGKYPVDDDEPLAAFAGRDQPVCFMAGLLDSGITWCEGYITGRPPNWAVLVRGFVRLVRGFCERRRGANAVDHGLHSRGDRDSGDTDLVVLWHETAG